MAHALSARLLLSSPDANQSTHRPVLSEVPARGPPFAINAVRDVILKNLDSSYEEGIQYGMIGYYAPHRIYPKGYRCDPTKPLQFAALGSQKNYMSLHLMSLYVRKRPGQQPRQMVSRCLGQTGKKLDMGKACIRFKKIEDLPLDLIGEAVRRVPASTYIKFCES